MSRADSDKIIDQMFEQFDEDAERRASAAVSGFIRQAMSRTGIGRQIFLPDIYVGDYVRCDSAIYKVVGIRDDRCLLSRPRFKHTVNRVVERWEVTPLSPSEGLAVRARTGRL